MTLQHIAMLPLFLTASLLFSSCDHGAHKPVAFAGGSPFDSLLAHSRDLGRAAADREVSLLLRLKDDSEAQREADVQSMYDPQSPAFLQFKTPEQLAAVYGPDPETVAGVRATLTAAGLLTDWQPGYDWLEVSGPSDRMVGTFGVEIHDYISDSGIKFFASVAEAAVPAALRPAVAGVGRVSSYPVAHLLGRQAAVTEGGLTPDGFLKAYNMLPLRQQGIDGTGETVVFWALADSYRQKDLDDFVGEYKLAPFQIEAVGPFPPATDAEAEGETAMDIEAVHAIAPGAKIVVYTLPGEKNPEVLAVYTRMINEHPHSIFNGSWGGCEAGFGNTAQAMDDAFAHGAQMGSTIFFSSGDQAAYTCLTGNYKAIPGDRAFKVSPSFPSTSSFVTSVGGTRLSVDKDGNWYNETVWEEPVSTGGTGGGISASFAMPGWQQGPGVKNQFSNGKRQVPDVSAVGDSATGMRVRTNGQWESIGGTSLSSPVWAGIAALLNQYLKKQGLHEVGLINPALYTIAAGNPRFPPFHDITMGGNLYYPATPGYDLATGLGTPDVWNLAQDLADYQRSGK